jgi:hypothetical protein
MKSSIHEVRIVECPNHGGAFDCTPFCRTCEGEQEYSYKYKACDVGGCTYNAYGGAPYHEANPRCESGKRSHCTCDTCF